MSTFTDVSALDLGIVGYLQLFSTSSYINKLSIELFAKS